MFTHTGVCKVLFQWGIYGGGGIAGGVKSIIQKSFGIVIMGINVANDIVSNIVAPSLFIINRRRLPPIIKGVVSCMVGGVDGGVGMNIIGMTTSPLHKGHVLSHATRHPRCIILLQHSVITLVEVLLRGSKHMGHSSHILLFTNLY